MANDLTALKASHEGKLPAYAFPGGYPVIYIASDGEVFCAPCANGENGSDARIANGPDDVPSDGWLLIGFDVFYEGPDEHCAHCGKAIASAYGDPAAKKEG